MRSDVGLQAWESITSLMKYNGIQLCHETPEYISCSSPAEIVNKIRQSSSSESTSLAAKDPEAEQKLENTKAPLRTLSTHARAKLIIESDSLSALTLSCMFLIERKLWYYLG